MARLTRGDPVRDVRRQSQRDFVLMCDQVIVLTGIRRVGLVPDRLMAGRSRKHIAGDRIPIEFQ